MATIDLTPYLVGAFVPVTAMVLLGIRQRRKYARLRARIQDHQQRIAEVRAEGARLSCSFWEITSDLHAQRAGELSLLLEYAKHAGDKEIADSVLEKLVENASILEATVEPALDSARAHLLVVETDKA